eukprot:CAMPEP_0175149914 /NCGR_PEP_ID=MMETSP0087-20121206/17546_1 /TAXON_ID=136419 /ORGANISM="Unknown Unknown, Strain D1" /LENGTH=102 /DNA_ID=CAMNT_0016435735 /DNA_START=50 /DNA_END=355 /DNA_ORIENTATION=+
MFALIAKSALTGQYSQPCTNALAELSTPPFKAATNVIMEDSATTHEAGAAACEKNANTCFTRFGLTKCCTEDIGRLWQPHAADVKVYLDAGNNATNGGGQLW